MSSNIHSVRNARKPKSRIHGPVNRILGAKQEEAAF